MTTKFHFNIAREAAIELYGTNHGTGQLDRPIAIILSAMRKQGVAIQLTRGRFAVVSPEDADLSLFDWHCTSHGRAARGKTEYMHKVIGERMGLSEEIDHIDGNPLNNRRSNLRVCTRTQNQGNVGKHVSRGNTSTGDKPTTHPYSTEQLEDTIVDLNEQLLSALAAIERAKKRTVDFNVKWPELESVDLSLLREHDRLKLIEGWEQGRKQGIELAESEAAEVRKPLVDALENLLSQSGDPNAKTGEFDTTAGKSRRLLDALVAKVKQ